MIKDDVIAAKLRMAFKFNPPEVVASVNDLLDNLTDRNECLIGLSWAGIWRIIKANRCGLVL